MRSKLLVRGAAPCSSLSRKGAGLPLHELDAANLCESSRQTGNRVREERRALSFQIKARAARGDLLHILVSLFLSVTREGRDARDEKGEDVSAPLASRVPRECQSQLRVSQQPSAVSCPSEVHLRIANRALDVLPRPCTSLICAARSFESRLSS